MTTAATKRKPKKKGAKPWYHQSNWLWMLMVTVIVGGAWYPLIGLAVMVCFLGAMISGPIAGRWWCGNVCPRGNFWDNIMVKIIAKPKMPAWAKNKVVRGVVLVALMTAMTVQIAFAWGDWEAVGRVFVVLLAVTTALGVIMALTGHQRAWCKVCPAGTVANWLSKVKKPQLKMDVENCTHCDACWSVCPMDLRPSEMAAEEGPTHSDCLKCSKCVHRCPVDVLELSSRDEDTQEGTAA